MILAVAGVIFRNHSSRYEVRHPPVIFRVPGQITPTISCLGKMVHQYIVFILDDQRYALHLSRVDRVVARVHITPLPGAPDIVLGVVNLQGRIIPVINLRQRFNLPQREAALTDRLIFAHMAHRERRLVALAADAVTEVIECSGESLIPPDDILAELKYLEGIIKLKDGLILIHNLDKFLSLEEEKSLDLALDVS